MESEKIRFLNNLGFLPKNGTNNILEKIYTNITIEIDIDNQRVLYPNINNSSNGFTIGRNTSSDLQNEESFSILECINTLLEQGYTANNIILEKPYPSGSAGKDIYLDIMVKYPNEYFDEKKQNKTYMMIEVKKKSEYLTEITKSLQLKSNNEPKSQLLTYYYQDKYAEYITYYTSYDNGKRNRQYHFIDTVEQNLNETNNIRELYQCWNKVYHINKGIFEQNNIYSNQIIPLKKIDLKDIDNDENSRKIYYQFLTILRKHAISDKANAFNKIFNLFICKIKDEDMKDDNEILDFQWKYNDSEEELLNRLNDLYKQGVYEYLKIKIEDTEKNDFDLLIQNMNVTEQKKLKNIYNQLRLYKNTEFSFIEVFDKETFDKNVKIIKEIVQLLETFKLKYNHKQQFLGDFFEHLLNTGLKQENGQFFTPIPLARFIINSIPLEQIVNKKICNNPKRLNGNQYEILPYCIDYAAGSGHFLTELMDECHNVLNKMKSEESFNNLNTNIRNTIESYTDERNLYNWAPEYIYGIEKDYRLAKTAKVACFLNGDGDANMLYADGLDNFSSSDNFKGILKTDQKNKDNTVFDIVVANPPYSVDSFKDFVKYGNESFDLFDKLGENSDDIECLFVERTKQLLKTGGIAGIILPTSILDNDGIFSHMRTILLKNFRIKSIVDMSSNGKVFAKTGTNTLILFLEKINESSYESILGQVKMFYQTKIEQTINHKENFISNYAENVYKISIDEYINLLNGKIFLNNFDGNNITFDNLNSIKRTLENIEIKNNECFQNYWQFFLLKFKNKKEDWDDKKLKKFKFSDFINYIKVQEIEKLSFFALNIEEKCLVINFPKDNKDLKSFIGYSFSERNSNEGIKYIKDENGYFISKLYSERNKFDTTKLNTIIYKHLSNEEIQLNEINEHLKPYIRLLNINSTIDFHSANWIKYIKPNKVSDKIYEDANCEYLELKNIIINDIINGSTPPKSIQNYWNKKDINWLTIKDMNNNFIITETEEYVTKTALDDKKIRMVSKNSLLLSCTATLGVVSITDIELATNQQVNAMQFNEQKINIKYIAYLFKNNKDFMHNLTNNPSVKHINIPTLKSIKLPIPTKSIQDKIVAEIENKKNTKNYTSILDKYLKNNIM